ERLMKKAVEATKEDLYVIEDMVDTAKANEEICVGLAANQIGETARIIVVKMGEYFIPLVNPKIVKHSQAIYEVEEACLSHEGTRKTTRYASIEVEYRDKNFRKKKQNFTGFVAQVIQHEMDHCEGILI
ncbi:peptide deformylase, partial [Niameybacter sp.]|uniref:peptide deformylase n=1 Tax=Niameybacter sp. TaxID=2033640 RepID=UPI002FC5D506